MRANEHAKAGSRADWKDVSIAGIPAEQYLGARTALLFGGADEFVVEQTSNGRSGCPFSNGKPAERVTGAAACAVDARGYWLTAAHAVDRAPLLVVAVTESDVVSRVAEVVWNGASEGVDLALLRTDGGVQGTLAWGARLPAAGRVLCCGSGLGSERFCAGRIRGVGGSTTDARFTEIAHDAPLSVGDSGGAAIAADGTFVGVNVATESRPFGRGEPDSTALLPAESFVRAEIERDVARRGAQRAPGS